MAEALRLRFPAQRPAGSLREPSSGQKGEGLTNNGIVKQAAPKPRHCSTALGNIGVARWPWRSFCWNAALMLYYLVGLVACLAVGASNSLLHRQLHENDLWFTNIKEVEREISFRTETGLYYSYYKQLVQAPSMTSGLHALTVDNHTEHPNTINILERFNVYPEVVLAAAWHAMPVTIRRALTLSGGNGQPILFYLYSIFGLQSLLVCSLVALTSAIAGGRSAWSSWPVGIVAALLYMCHRVDTTRVTHTAPLRESFALPFLWAQIACVTYFFRASTARTAEAAGKLGIFVFTLLFSICWQFNQFVLLLQAVSLFAAWSLKVIPARKVVPVLMFHVLSLTMVSILQFGSKILLTSFLMSFAPAALLVIYLWRPRTSIETQQSACHMVGRLIGTTVTVVCLTGILRFAVKNVFIEKADEHIYKFVLAKFNYAVCTDFDTQLYLCNGAFSFLDRSFFDRMARNHTLPLYAVLHVTAVVMLLYRLLRPAVALAAAAGAALKPRSLRASLPPPTAERCPEVLFNAIQSVPFACMAIFVMRMKYLWSVYMCVFAPVAACGHLTWSSLAKLTRMPPWLATVLRIVSAFFYAALLLHTHVPGLQSDLQQEREFWDPDTVELMEWIKNSTSRRSAFSGSMQLMAGVKLCTQRPIINHPHYEDEGLRSRTWELYQMYGRKPAHEMHSTLRRYNTSYIILEDSICLIPPDGCKTPDIVDVANGMLPRGNVRLDVSGLVRSTVPRFCEEVRHGQGNYSRFFKLVMVNKTFRVYQVL